MFGLHKTNANPGSNGTAITNNPYSGFDHLRFTVTNAKQAASYYCTRLGFKHVAYRGLETGSREIASHVVRRNDATFVFECAIQPGTMPEMTKEIAKRGDGVKDIAFTVTDCRAVYEVNILSFILGKRLYSCGTQFKHQLRMGITCFSFTYTHKPNIRFNRELLNAVESL